MANKLSYVMVICLLIGCSSPLMAEEVAVPPDGKTIRHTPLDLDYWRELAPRPQDLWGETKETFWGWNFGYVAATAGLAGGLAFLDADMQEPWQKGDELLGTDLTKIGDVVGNPGVQAGVMGLTYTLGQYIGDPTMTQAGKSMADTMIFTALTSLALKGMFHRERPDGHDHLSFPSWHASATFGNATVLAEYYGWKAAIPAYLVSIFVGWSRIEDNSHFVSDVVAGAAIGCIYGHAISRYNMKAHPNVSIEPVAMRGGTGMQATMRF